MEGFSVTSSHDEVQPITSVTELMAAGAALVDYAATRYAEYAAACAAAGNAEPAGILQRLATECRADSLELASRAAAVGQQLAGVDQRPSAAPDALADEDPYTVTAYRVLSIAVHDATHAFAFYAYVAAHAAEGKLQQVAESLAHEQLGYAAQLRNERRKAWRRTQSGTGRSPPPPQNLAELRTLAGRREGDMAARHAGLAEAAEALGDLESAKMLRGIAAEAAGLLPPGRYPAPASRAETPEATGAYELLHTALVDLEDAYTWYLRAAEGRAGEEAMLDAQRWAASALRRSSTIRSRLTAVARAARP